MNKKQILKSSRIESWDRGTRPRGHLVESGPTLNGAADPCYHPGVFSEPSSMLQPGQPGR
jgi:hypothetical protein